MDKFLLRSINILKTFLDKSVRGFTDQQLLDLHRKTHMMYAGNSKRERPNKKFLGLLVKKHNEMAKELKRRGKQHFSPLP